MSQKPIVTSAIVVLLVLTTAGIATVGQSFRPPAPVNSSAVARQLARSEDPAAQGRAWDFYVQRCADGEGRACGRAGWMQKEREPGIDYLSYFAEGCDRGDGWSCAQYAHNLRPELEHGDGDAMVDALRKGCQGKSAWSCMKLGYEYNEGVFVPKDSLLASYLFRTSCAEGEAYGCLYLGQMYDEAGEFELGDAWYVDGCEKGMPFSCAVAGSRLKERQPEQAGELLREACEDGIDWACKKL